MHRLKDLRSPHLKLIFSGFISILLIWQRINNISWLHGWLLPDRRKIQAHWVGSERRQLRPVNLLFPTAILQMTVFVLAIVNHDYFAPIFAAGNLGVVGLALIPLHTRKPKPLCHWV